MITVSPIDVSSVTEAIEAMLNDADAVGGVGVKIEVSEDIPEAAYHINGWVGVYRQRVRYPTRTLGLGTGYRGQNIELILLVQHSDLESGKKCSINLENLVKNVIAVLLNDTSLKGLVQNLDNIEVGYERYNKTDSDVFTQLAVVYVTALGYVQVTL